MPQAPLNYIWVGLALAFVSGALLAIRVELAWALFAIASTVLTIGVVGHGVFIGMRLAQYQEYLDRIIEDAESDGPE